MKKIHFPVFAVIFFVNCNNPQPSHEEKVSEKFTIAGNIAGLDSADVYFMHKVNDDRVTDTVKVRQGKFSYSGKVDEPGMFYLDILTKDGRARVDIFTENSEIKIDGKLDNLDSLKISGSKVHDECEQYGKSISPFTSQLDSITELYEAKVEEKDKKAMDDLDSSYEKVQEQMNAAIKKYVFDHPSSYVSAFVAVKYFTIQPELEELKSLFASLDSVRQQSQYGKTLKEAIEAAERTTIGAPAPEITMNDTSSKPVSLSSFKGKVTLVDFWASWCGPCRRENPNIVNVYSKFHKKGLEIFAVSLDKDETKWEDAIVKDKLAWTHVSDLKYWNSEAAKLYGVRSIPANFLLDKEGKIIAQNLHGEELEKKLVQILSN